MRPLKQLCIVRRHSYLVTVVICTVFPALAETFAIELAPFNIPVLLVVPGSFATEGMYSQSFDTRNAIPAYDAMREASKLRFVTLEGSAKGDPNRAMEALADVVRGQGVANGRPWPSYLVLGEDADRDVEMKCRKVLAALDEWKDVATSMNLDEA